jgi:unspecific monooxygenase
MDPVRTPVDTGLSWRRFTHAYNADRLGYLTTLPALGPVVRMAANLVFVSDPALIETVVRRTNTDFQMRVNRRLESVAAGRGDAALDAWMEARRRALSGVHRVVNDGDPVGQAVLREQVQAWAAATQPTNVVEDLTRLNLRASVRLVVGRPDPDLEHRTSVLLSSLVAVVDGGSRLPGPLAYLSRRHRRARRDDEALRDYVFTRIDTAPRSGCIVGELADAGIDRDTIANLAVAMLLAGTLVPAAAGAWILALLTAHRHWQDRVREEPGTTAWVINEALRLYPPTWLISRTVAHDGVYAEWRLRAGDEVVISPYVSHRDAGVFSEPEKFRPERWADLQPGVAHFLPFGAGPRRCVAAELAWQRLHELVQQVVQTTTGLSGTFPRSVSTTSTLFPSDFHVRFSDHRSDRLSSR